MSMLGELAALDRLPDIGGPLIGDGGQFSKGLPAVNRAADIASRMPGHMLGSVLSLPRRAIENSQYSLDTGNYDPAVPIEAAMTAMTGGVAGTGPGGVALGSGPIKAYHSSPHDFDKFDLAKIGTGEGAQVYGHGLYFAESPAVSGQGGQYWNSFSRHSAFDDVEKSAALRLQEAGFDRAKAIELAQRDIETARARMLEKDRPPNPDFFNRVISAQEAQIERLKSNKPVGPRTYEVNINADPAHMLDWDKGLHSQSPEVRAALEPFGFKSDKKLMQASDDALYAALTGDPHIKIPQALPDPTGAQIYESSKLVPGGYRDKVRATERLHEAGIPGIKYLDQGSRAGIPPMQAMLKTVELQDALAVAKSPAQRAAIEAELAALEQSMKPTSNYVIFDPSKIDIMKKYAMPGMIGAGGMGAVAAQDQYQP